MERRARVTERPSTENVHVHVPVDALSIIPFKPYQRRLSALANGAFALCLMITFSPLFFTVALLVWLSNGRPLTYSGRRLGYQGQVFWIHKFRTLVVDAERTLGSDLVSKTDSKRDLTIRFGKFLRATRLDELPQLINVLRGEMSFVGPRPERPDVYRANCAKIPNYNLRFAVKPGLIGVSQVVTPHCTDKRYRSWLDNRVVRSRPSYFRKISFLLFAVGHLSRSLLSYSLHIVVEKIFRQRILRSYEQKRAARRYQAGRTCVFFGDQRQFPVRDVSEDAILVLSQGDISPSFPSVFTLRLELPAKYEWPRVRRADCLGELVVVREVEGIFENVIRFKPTTPKSEYLIQKYLLRESIV